MTTHAQLETHVEDIRVRFFSDPVSFRAEEELSTLLDDAVLNGWSGKVPEAGCAVLAVGGYGRKTLHPSSDLDLLVYFEEKVVEKFVDDLLKPLWDLPFRVGHQIRQASDFDQFDPGQMESYTAFMDARFLWGAPETSARFIGKLLPEFIGRYQGMLLKGLVDMKTERWEGYGGTVFQLEPDLKTSPGGLRDYHWSRWMARVIGIDSSPGLEDAVGFLHQIRNYLHFMSGRDQNILTYEYQEKIAAELGYEDSERGEAAENLMREYFLRAESLAAEAQTLEDELSGRRDSLAETGPLTDSASILEIFERVHREKLDLDSTAMEKIRSALSRCESEDLMTGENGRAVVRMMRNPEGIYRVLRLMHRVGLLGAIFPEFEEIRSRVIRDFFHKYTVDQHSLIAVRNIEQLSEGVDVQDVPRGFGSILGELEHPELLMLALLLHDTGKAFRHPEGAHACSSVEVLDGVLRRLALPGQQQDRVRAAIQNHLEMSRIIMRRDIGDPSVVAQFAELIGTEEDLRMLCLLTYADMKAVSPEVWTAWKGDLLFQLYLETFKRLRHDFAEDRYTQGQQAHGAKQEHTQVRSFLSPEVDPSSLADFLEGLPKQFLRSTSAERIAVYYQGYLKYSEKVPVVIDWFQKDDLWEILVMTADTPLLFSRIAGALAAFGMNTVRAQAFSNSRGVVFDLIAFEDPNEALEKNPSERKRLEDLIVDSITGAASLDELIQRRSSSVVHRRKTAAVPVAVHFDPTSDKRTIMEIVASDDVGLLFHVSRAIAELGCNIEIALVSTEGRRALDVFYLTWNGQPLTDGLQEQLRGKIEDALEPLSA